MMVISALNYIFGVLTVICKSITRVVNVLIYYQVNSYHWKKCVRVHVFDLKRMAILFRIPKMNGNFLTVKS